MVGQHHRAVRPAEHSCEIDDFQPGQRAGTLRRGFILGHGGSVVHAAASFECLSAGFGIDFEHLIDWPIYEIPMKLSKTPAYIGGPINRGAPCYGEDNMYVLTELLGRTPSEVERLAEEGVI